MSDCCCLVLLDGLDEVSDQKTRIAVQQAIKKFIADQRHPEKQLPTYNRFIVTSRIAGYDQKTFPNYPHYLIAELTREQIEGFLPRWCHASARGEVQEDDEEAVLRRADEMSKRLKNAVSTNSGVRDLAENPLLLTLLAAMQLKGTDLPDRRAELYRIVTKTLLEDRNAYKGTPQLPEAEAIQRLGPLAFEIHKEGNGLACEEYALGEIKKAIASLQGGGGSSALVEETAQNYLKRISERGGLFVRRTGDWDRTTVPAKLGHVTELTQGASFFVRRQPGRT